ncbi:MAG TPA: hypothetical protein PK711_02495 [Bacteroidales bacterium]|nr:hypothetical protein [Bacteroidales bacterium]
MDYSFASTGMTPYRIRRWLINFKDGTDQVVHYHRQEVGELPAFFGDDFYYIAVFIRKVINRLLILI